MPTASLIRYANAATWPDVTPSVATYRPSPLHAKAGILSLLLLALKVILNGR